MVLCSKIRLDALASRMTPFVYVLASPVTTHEANSFNLWMVADGIDRRNGAVYDVENTRRQARSLAEFCNDHGCSGVTLGGLDDKSVAGGEGHGYGPEGDHGWKVEGCYAEGFVSLGVHELN